MLESIPHQKLFFFIIYLLEDEQEFKLGDSWYVSNYYIIYAIILSILDVNGLYFTLLYNFWD